jgi:hypothetical protein
VNTARSGHDGVDRGLIRHDATQTQHSVIEQLGDKARRGQRGDLEAILQGNLGPKRGSQQGLHIRDRVGRLDRTLNKHARRPDGDTAFPQVIDSADGGDDAGEPSGSRRVGANSDNIDDVLTAPACHGGVDDGIGRSAIWHCPGYRHRSLVKRQRELWWYVLDSRSGSGGLRDNRDAVAVDPPHASQLPGRGYRQIDRGRVGDLSDQSGITAYKLHSDRLAAQRGLSAFAEVIFHMGDSPNDGAHCEGNPQSEQNPDRCGERPAPCRFTGHVDKLPHW